MSHAKPIDPVALLDKMSALYPAGVPRRFIRAPQVEQDAADESIKALFIAVYGANQMPAHDAEFLESVASKGLKLKTSEYRVCVHGTREQGESRLRELSANLQPKMAIVFYESELSVALSRDVETAHGGQLSVIRAPALSYLASNSEAKRSFWKLLQGVLPLVAER